jgi:glycosyltransferase involved in cell wall biosynthesis
MSDKISIIVPTYNRREQLRTLLESFNKMECSCEFEIIIVDDRSNDGTSGMLHEWHTRVPELNIVYKLLEERSGPSHARNIGITLSSGNILAFTDSDCRVDILWAEYLYNFLRKNPSLGGVGGKVLPVDRDIISRYYTIQKLLEPPQSMINLIGANCIFWKHVVVQAGMFDESFTVPGGEEVCLSYKILDLGYHFGFEERAIVYHDYRSGIRDFVKTFLNYGSGERNIIERHFPLYLKFVNPPEKLKNSIALQNHKIFLFYFLKHQLMTTLFYERHFLKRKRVKFKDYVVFQALFNLMNVSFHLGRGTYSGVFRRRFERHISDNFLGVSPEINQAEFLRKLKVTRDTITTMVKPGINVNSSVSFINTSGQFYKPRGNVLITLDCNSPDFSQSEILLPEKLFFYPNMEYTCFFPFRSPVKEGNYTVKIMLKDIPERIACQALVRNVMVTSYPPNSEASIINDTFPEKLRPDMNWDVSIFMKNTGEDHWNEKSNVLLGAVDDHNNDAPIFGPRRIKIPEACDIIPGSIIEFRFTIRAPRDSGDYTLKYRMVRENVRWFGEIFECIIKVFHEEKEQKVPECIEN